MLLVLLFVFVFLRCYTGQRNGNSASGSVRFWGSNGRPAVSVWANFCLIHRVPACGWRTFCSLPLCIQLFSEPSLLIFPVSWATTNPTWRPNPGRRGRKTAANRLSYGVCSLGSELRWSPVVLIITVLRYLGDIYRQLTLIWHWWFFVDFSISSWWRGQEESAPTLLVAREALRVTMIGVSFSYELLRVEIYGDLHFYCHWVEVGGGGESWSLVMTCVFSSPTECLVSETRATPSQMGRLYLKADCEGKGRRCIYMDAHLSSRNK
jgi:hypothetical protein